MVREAVTTSKAILRTGTEWIKRFVEWRGLEVFAAITGTIVLAYLAYQANQIIERQNQLIALQAEPLIVVRWGAVEDESLAVDIVMQQGRAFAMMPQVQSRTVLEYIYTLGEGEDATTGSVWTVRRTDSASSSSNVIEISDTPNWCLNYQYLWIREVAPTPSMLGTIRISEVWLVSVTYTDSLGITRSSFWMWDGPRPRPGEEFRPLSVESGESLWTDGDFGEKPEWYDSWEDSGPYLVESALIGDGPRHVMKNVWSKAVEGCAGTPTASPMAAV